MEFISILVGHIIVLFVILFAIRIIVIRKWLTGGLLYFFALLIGGYAEFNNEFYAKVVSYPYPHLITVPKTSIPLEMILGWGAFAVFIYYLVIKIVSFLKYCVSFKKYNVLKGKSSYWVGKFLLLCKCIVNIFFYLLVTFCVGYSFEWIAVNCKIWIYKDEFLPFRDGPMAWMIVMTGAGFLTSLSLIVIEMMSYIMLKLKHI